MGRLKVLCGDDTCEGGKKSYFPVLVSPERVIDHLSLKRFDKRVST